jgi:uncharacterized protein (TIGR00369 family)
MNDLVKHLDFWAIVEGREPPPPAARLLGWRFIGLDEHGVLSCSFEATEAMLNPAGVVQGGMLAAMLDEIMGPLVAAISREQVFTQTLEMKISYMRPAHAGTILGEGRILHRGRNVVFLEGRLLNREHDLVALGSSTARVKAAVT